MEVRSGRHCLFVLHAHLVFVTKYRKAVFSQKMLKSLEGYFRKICIDFQCELTEFNGEKDHVHLLVNYPPKVSLSKLVNSLKGASSRRMRSEYKQVLDQIYWKDILWSPSYFAGSVGGAPISVLKKYIEQQQRPI